VYRVVCLDLDGTLLNSNKNISKSDRETIKKLKKHNVQVVLASGRHIWEITKYARELDLTAEDFIVSCDGQYIYDSFGNLLWENLFLSKRDVLWLVKKLSANFSVFTNDRDYKLKNYVGYKCLLRKIKKIQNKKEQISLIELLLLPMLEIEKIVIVGIPVTSIKRKRFGAREYSGGRLELTYCNVDKYTAIAQLRKMGCIKDGDKILYFGDDVNDKMCFEKLHYCVAMGNAIPEIKEKALFITKDCDNSGVSFALEKIFDMKELYKEKI